MFRKLTTAAVVTGLLVSAVAADAGAVPTHVRHWDTVLAHTIDTYHITFRAQEAASVLVAGGGETDLDLYVYDEHGNLIASDTDYSDYCVARFTPRWTGPFTIKIVNRGSISNSYLLATN